jgi:hypothetical protein
MEVRIGTSEASSWSGKTSSGICAQELYLQTKDADASHAVRNAKDTIGGRDLILHKAIVMSVDANCGVEVLIAIRINELRKNHYFHSTPCPVLRLQYSHTASKEQTADIQ